MWSTRIGGDPKPDATYPVCRLLVDDIPGKALVILHDRRVGGIPMDVVIHVPCVREIDYRV